MLRFSRLSVDCVFDQAIDQTVNPTIDKPPSHADIAEQLTAIEIFRDLPGEELERIAAQCRWQHFALHQQIIQYQDQSRDIYFILHGIVRATIYSATGREVTFRDAGVGEIMGELSAIDGGPRTAYVVALAETDVASMTADAFMRVLDTHPAVANAMLRHLVGIVRTLTDRVVEFSTLPVKTRLHVELLRMAHDNMRSQNSAVVLPAPTHAEIANRVSSVREAVSREMAKLSHSGIIARHSDALLINDIGRLHQLVGDAL